jgi:hypothetical protein
MSETNQSFVTLRMRLTLFPVTGVRMSAELMREDPRNIKQANLLT